MIIRSILLLIITNRNNVTSPSLSLSIHIHIYIYIYTIFGDRYARLARSGEHFVDAEIRAAQVIV